MTIERPRDYELVIQQGAQPSIRTPFISPLWHPILEIRRVNPLQVRRLLDVLRGEMGREALIPQEVG